MINFESLKLISNFLRIQLVKHEGYQINVFIAEMSGPETEQILCHSCGLLLTNQIHDELCTIKSEYKCFKCDKSFSKLKYLHQHRNTHSNLKFKCSLCDKELKTKQNLQEHINKLHTLCKEDSICELCDSKFKRKSDLKRHKLIHTNKLYVCITCNKQFHYKYNFDRHVNTCKQY